MSENATRLSVPMTLVVRVPRPGATRHDVDVTRTIDRAVRAVADMGGQMLEATLVSHAEEPAPVTAVRTALACFRAMYDAIENGADADDLYADQSLWPLAELWDALGE